MARSGYRTVTLTNDVHSQLTELAVFIAEHDKRKVGVAGVITRLVGQYGEELKTELQRERERADSFVFLERSITQSLER